MSDKGGGTKMLTRGLVFGVLLLGFALPVAVLGTEAPGAGQAVRKALPVLQKSAVEYTRQVRCFSCHHQAVPLLALTAARDRGFPVDAEVLKQQVDFTYASLSNGRAGYAEGRGQGGQVTTAAYALFTLELGGRKPDDLSTSVAGYLTTYQKDLGHWRPQAQRPPSEASHFTDTYLAARSLRVFGGPDRKEAAEQRRSASLEWALATPAVTTEDHVFRLLALHELQAPQERVKEAGKSLLERQREDGGWAQTDEMASDAYATGSALWALHHTGSIAAGDDAYRRGLSYLVGSQKPDGTWHVATRSRPIQPYFESGFPHGKDQFISMAATAWATAALALGATPAEP